MQNIKAIVLDMYGVILKQTGDDFIPYIQKFFPNLTKEDIETPWFKADKGDTSSLEVWKALGFKGDLEAVEKEYLDTIEVNDGFYEFAEAVQGKYKLAIVSNDSSRWSHYQRERYGIDKYFDAISISGDVKIKKPDPRIYLQTVEKIGCTPSECIYADDRTFYLGTAKSLGFNAVLFNNCISEYDGLRALNFTELMNLINNN